MDEKIVILDFGSQYTQLIGRKIRELNVYCEIVPWNVPLSTDETCKGVILSGSPYSVNDKEAPCPDLSFLRGKVPILGICYGAQHLVRSLGGKIAPSAQREYGRAIFSVSSPQTPLFHGIKSSSTVWMSHGDSVASLPDSLQPLGATEEIPYAAFRVNGEETYGIQFHPEVHHSEEGQKILYNFVVSVCNCRKRWTSGSFVETTVKNLRSQLGKERVVLGLSGGVDSTVAAVLLQRAIGEQLICIFVNNGLLRKGEYNSVLGQYQDMGLTIRGVDATDTFLDKLKGVTDPEQKRKIIGHTFIKVFDNEAQRLKGIKWLGQGTIYPDVIESFSVQGPSDTIKSHHNVGGLPDKMKLKIVEPLKWLFKDEVRRVGEALGISPVILGRHPFPGPGLGIRILGEVTRERVAILQEADHIYISELKKQGLYDTIWQAGAILLPVQTVGVMGDERTYENTLALRAVASVDGMTADWIYLPYEFLGKVANEIINRVKGINRVVYDISSKPPATIEWE